MVWPLFCRYPATFRAHFPASADSAPSFAIQCSIPAFCGLFPNSQHDSCIQRLLYVCCIWNSLAKLRLQTDATLSMLEDATRSLGEVLREFTEVACPSYKTMETDREVAGCHHREQCKAATARGPQAKGAATAAGQKSCMSPVTLS
jgi:hypothetical protein